MRKLLALTICAALALGIGAAVVVIDCEDATIKRVIKSPAGVILQPESPNP